MIGAGDQIRRTSKSNLAGFNQGFLSGILVPCLHSDVSPTERPETIEIYDTDNSSHFIDRLFLVLDNHLQLRRPPHNPERNGAIPTAHIDHKRILGQRRPVKP